MKYPLFFSINLTWNGQDFGDASRNETLWNKAKEYVAKQGGSFTFDILVDLLKMMAKQTIGLP